MDWVAAVIELIAAWVIGNKNKYGYILFIIGGMCWLAHSLISKGTYGLFLVIVPAFFINVRNYIKWKREEKDVVAVEKERS